MNERVKQVRKMLGLTQDEFGRRLGVTRGAITNIEYNKVEPKPLLVDLICKEFSVNKDWLYTGEGEMFVKMDPDEEFAKLMVEIQVANDEFIINALKAYWELPEEHKQVVKDLIKKIAGK